MTPLDTPQDRLVRRSSQMSVVDPWARGPAAVPSVGARGSGCPILLRFIEGYAGGLEGEQRREVLERWPEVRRASSDRAACRWRLERCREQHRAMFEGSRADRLLMRMLRNEAAAVCAAAFLVAEAHSEALEFLDGLMAGDPGASR
jgi:hypothetical protein